MTAAALVGFTGSASADEPPPAEWDHKWTTPGATVYVREYGDVISLCDTAADGNNAYVHVEWASDYYSFLTNGGKGSCKSSSANIPEEAWVRVEYNGGGGINRADFKNDH